MQILNLREFPAYTESYVELRNLNIGPLLTRFVDLEETIHWLETARTDVWGAVVEGKVIGASVLYYEKNAELAIFAKQTRQGVGSMLLKQLEKHAEGRTEKIWAWTLLENQAAANFFRKHDYTEMGLSEKIFLGKVYLGQRFEKKLGALRN